MKIKLLIFAVAILFVACEKYEDFVVDTIGFTAVYFPHQELERSIVAGEGLEIKVGAFIGGVMNNTEDRNVQFSIEDSLLDGTDYELLPADYYTLSNSSEIIIEQGEYLGMIGVKFDSLKLTNDLNLLDFHYALPLVITSANVDSIHGSKNYTVIPLKLMNTYEGSFYQVGQMKEFFTAKHVLDRAYVYGDSLDGPNTPVRKLTSVMMDTVVVDGIATHGGDGYSMKLKVNADNTVEVIAVPSSTYQVEPNGVSTWDPVKRKFHLNYKYTYNDKNFEVQEMLTFRNRIRDGINEWRWEGFPGN